MATLPGLLVNLTLQSAQFVQGMNQANRSLSSLQRSVNQAKAVLGGLVGGAAIREMVQLSRAALDTVGGLGELAQVAGISARQLQILTVAGLQLGVSQEQLITAISQFNRRVGEAAQGTGELRDTLARYNIAVKTSAGDTRGAVDILGDLAEAVQNADSAQEKATISAEAFGSRIGARLLPLLSEGREGFQRWAEEAERAGLVIGDDMINRADAASDSLAVLQQAITTGFNVAIVDAFSDSVSSSADALQQAREAGEQFGRVVGTAMRVAAEALKLAAQYSRELGTAIAFFIGLRLFGIVVALGTAFYDMAKAIKAAAAAQQILNILAFRFGKILLPVLAGILVAAFAYKALGGDISDATKKVEDFFTTITGGAGLVPLSKDAETAADSIKGLRAELELQLSQQERLNEALGGGPAINVFASLDRQKQAVQDITDAIEVENALTRGTITLEQARAAGLDVLAEKLQAQKRLAEDLEKTLAVRAGAADEAAQLQLVVDARGRETEELRVQQALLKAKQDIDADAATIVETEVRALEKVRTKLDQIHAARDLGDTIEQQRLLLHFGGQETQEYRVQLRLLELKRELGDEAAAGLEEQVRLLESQTTQIEKAAEGQRLFIGAIENALENVQAAFADTFEQIFRGGIDSFSDLASAVKDIFIRLAAEIAALMTIRPLLAPLTAGLGAGGFGGAGSLAAALGFGGAGATGSFAAGTLVTPGGVPIPSLDRGAPFPTTVGPNLLGPGILGGLGGALLAPLLFGGGVGTSIGGGLGGALGAGLGAFLVPGPLGAILGGVGGSLLGGVLGSLFGGGGATGSQVAFGRGSLGGVGIGGTNEASGFIRQLDQSILELLNERQTSIADRMLRDARTVGVQFGDEGPSAADLSRLAAARIGPTAQALGFRRGAIAGGGRTPEQQLELLASAIELERAIEDLTGAVTPFRRQLMDLRTEFAEMEARAKEFGISTKGMAKALREAEDALRDQQRAEREAARAQIDQLALSIVSPFEEISGSLEAFQRSLAFEGMNPREQLAAAAADFERIAALAERGNLGAIAQLEGAGRLFIEQSGRFGASPAQAAAREQVSGVITDVLQEVEQAQREATRGVQDEVARGNKRIVDTLGELIRVSQDTADEIKKLRNEQRQGKKA